MNQIAIAIIASAVAWVAVFYRIRRRRLAGPSIFIAGSTARKKMLAIARTYRDKGYRRIIINTDHSQNPSEQTMRDDLAELLTCDAVAVLPMWRWLSRSRLHVAAASESGIPVLDAETLLPIERFKRKLEVVEAQRECECVAHRGGHCDN